MSVQQSCCCCPILGKHLHSMHPKMEHDKEFARDMALVARAPCFSLHVRASHTCGGAVVDDVAIMSNPFQHGRGRLAVHALSAG